MLNKGVHPVIPCQGSLGASGDLAPLAHLALVLIGEGEAELNGTRMPGNQALAKVGLTPVVLKAKEGLALVNGTQMMTAIGALAVLEAETLCKVADISGAMKIEGFLGSHRPFIAEVQALRPHPGQITSAANFRKLLAESEVASSHANCKKIQDPYSFRCIPQVHGAVRDTVGFVRGVIEREINAVTDNPLIFPELGEAVSQGNFHGSLWPWLMDYLGIALAELGNITELRVDKLNDPNFSELPAFLTEGRGTQLRDDDCALYRRLSRLREQGNGPPSQRRFHSILQQQGGSRQHGAIAARKAAKILSHVRTILAMKSFARPRPSGSASP